MILSQTPAPSGAPDPDLVTPGTIGFLVTLAIVVVVIFLIRDALRRVRRVRARSAASDAYPIPLRKHAVPNQSSLSGAQSPEAKNGKRAGRSESSTAEGRRAPGTGADPADAGPAGASSAGESQAGEPQAVERPSGAGSNETNGQDTGDQTQRPPR